MKCALITGGSRGIGRSVAITLAKDLGLHILINYASNTSAAEETKKAIEDNGGSADLLQFDVSNKVEVDKALEDWFTANPEGAIEVLVNNAGVTKDGLMVFMEESDWDTVLNIHLKGMFNVTKAVLQKMVRARYGRIINMVSLSGLKGVAGQTNYSAAKGGIIATTRSLSLELAKRKITVNAVAPGFIRSDMTKDLDEQGLKQMIPVQRFGEPQEVADLVSFLASARSAYITGEVININGGIHS